MCGDWDGARAHVSSRNHELDGICFAGNFVGTEPTDAALAGARLLRDLSVEAHGEAPEAGHGSWALAVYPTSCPGDDYGAAWIPKIATAGDDEEEDMTDEQWSTLLNVQKQTLELLHLIKGGALGSQKGLEYAKSTWGRLERLEAKLDTMPTLAVDAKAIAKAAIDELHERTAE